MFARRVMFHPFVRHHMTTRIMRLAANAPIRLHHHPGHDESFTVEEGAARLELDGRSYDVRRGDVVLIPAGTTIGGTNGPAGSTVVVVWANTGPRTTLTAGAAHAPR